MYLYTLSVSGLSAPASVVQGEVPSYSCCVALVDLFILTLVSNNLQVAPWSHKPGKDQKTVQKEEGESDVAAVLAKLALVPLVPGTRAG